MSSSLIVVVLATALFLTVCPAELTRMPNTESPKNDGRIWAFLTAGSVGYYNYRHQADICHAYQILRSNGIPEDNIIVMMADDVANDPRNPTPGIIINKPNGKDVYKGVKKDYTGNDVTVENFLNVLTGNKKAMENVGTGRVIESGSNDTIFVNFVDHGAPGILSFPVDILAAKTFIATLQNLASQKKFSQMFLFIEACYSGSMFDNLLDDALNIFVMTASDSKENSYATYYDKERQTYLGDLFSINWMEENEKENLKNRSFHHLYEKVRYLTESKSHVEEYGDLDIGNTKLFQTFGSHLDETLRIKDENIFSDPLIDAIPVPDVYITTLERRLKDIDSTEESKILDTELKLIYEKRRIVDKIMSKIVAKLSRKNKLIKEVLQTAKYSITKKTLDCHDEVMKIFSRSCFNISKNPYVAQSLQILVNACSIYRKNSRKIVRAIEYSCENVDKIYDTV